MSIGSWSSGTLTYPKGRMTEATTTASGSVNTGVVYSYDPVGRISDLWQCNPSNCGTSSIYAMAYGYDKAGDVTSWSHPGLINLNNTVNAAQQITGVTTTSSYTNLPQTLVQSVTYTPFGAVSTFEDGCAGSSCTNAQETYQYNKQLQPAVIELGASGGNAAADYCLVYNYYGSSPTSCVLPSAGTTNNGNVMGYWYQDSVNSSFGHTASYGYDGVNRLNAACTLSGSQCATSGSNVYNLAFAYDQFGNMHCTGGVGGGSAIGYCPAWAYNNSTNQLSSSTGCAYDAAGNLTKDCSTASNHTYQWDAEGRVASVDSGSTWSFTYNALGERVQMAGPGGTQELMYDPSGAWLGIYGVVDLLPWGGGYFAWYNGTDTYFNHINNLGSSSMLTNHAGTAVEDVLFYPWGQNTWESSGSGGYEFAGMPYYDTTTNTNLTPFRFYSPGLGRWLSPDPLGGDITNPQSLNRYPYVMNNPTTSIDPLGLDGYASGPPCGAYGQISCQQYYQYAGPATGWCPPAYDYCYATMGGATIGVVGSMGIAFLQNVPVNVLRNGQVQPCNAAEISGGECNGGLGTVFFAAGTVQQSPNLLPTFIPAGPGSGGSGANNRLTRLKNCALGYYGIDPLSAVGLSSDAKWGLIALSAGGVPKGLWQALGGRVIWLPGASPYTSVLSIISSAGGGGALRTVANFASRWAGPIAIASAVIDATAIGVCTASD